MTDDQSFYEIQLNTPHLVLAFLGSAVLGVAVFWLGVVIGRGQGEPSIPGEWRAAVSTQSADDRAGQNLEEAEAEPATPQPATPQRATPQPGVASTAVDEPAAGANAPAAATDRQAADSEFTPAQPVDERPAQVVAQSSSGLPTPDAALASGWLVQVRSTPEENDANSLQSALVRAGFPAFVVSAEVSGVTYYRVRVGRYRFQDDAQIIEAELLGRSDVETTWVTEG